MQFELEKFNINKFDDILSRGLSHGLGKQGESVCIEAAICETLGLPHGDDPGCVSAAVRSFKINLNDSEWSSPIARAKGLRKLGIAQLGSKGVIDDIQFAKLLSERTIRILIPKLFRDLFAGNKELLAAADRCEKEGSAAAAYAAKAAAYAAYAAYAASAAKAAANAAYAAKAAYAAEVAAYAAKAAYAAEVAAYAAEVAAYAAKNGDSYLLIVADIALQILVELKSPGVKLL